MILAEAADFPHTVQPSGKWKNNDVIIEVTDQK